MHSSITDIIGGVAVGFVGGLTGAVALHSLLAHRAKLTAPLRIAIAVSIGASISVLLYWAYTRN